MSFVYPRKSYEKNIRRKCLYAGLHIRILYIFCKKTAHALFQEHELLNVLHYTLLDPHARVDRSLRPGDDLAVRILPAVVYIRKISAVGIMCYPQLIVVEP